MKNIQKLGLAAVLVAVAALSYPVVTRSACGSCGAEASSEAKAAKKGCPFSHKHRGACGHHGKFCPGKIPGADVKVEKISNGIIVRITSKDKTVVKKIHASAAKIGKKSCKACAAGKKCARCEKGKKECPYCR